MKNITLGLIFFAVSATAQQTDSLQQETPPQEADSVRNLTIEQVVVEARRVYRRGDREVIYLSEENRSFGANALNAISSLDHFETALHTTSLTSWDRQQVYILINDVPSSAIELRTYRSEDIKRVEYYQVTPAKYMGLTSGPVLNVIVKRRHNRQYSGYFDINDAVNTGFGENQLAFTYTDSLNQIRVNYYASNRHIHAISTLTEFRYNAGLHSRYEGSKVYRGITSVPTITYQRYQGNHLFNLKISDTYQPGRQTEDRTGAITSEGERYEGAGASSLKSRSNALAVNLFYRYLIKNDRSFTANIINTFGASHSSSQQQLFTLTDNTAFDYDLFSRLRNRTYSLIANASFSTPLLRGKFNAAARYQYSRLRQTSLDDSSENDAHNEFVSAGMLWRLNNDCVTLRPTIGLNATQQTTMSRPYNTVQPYFRLYVDKWDRAGRQSVQLTVQTQHISPSLGQLSTGITYLDPWLISTGNPDLKPYWRSSAGLVFLYRSKARHQVALKLYQSYASDAFASTLEQAEDHICLRPQNIGADYRFHAELTAKWRPARWLEISPYLEFYYLHFNTPSQRINRRYGRCGASTVARFDRWTLILAANSPVRSFDGDLLERGSEQFYAGIDYALKSWTFGLEYSYSGNRDYTVAQFGDFRYYNCETWKPLRTKVALTATYSFSIGRSRRHVSPAVGSGSSDTGLDNFNTVKMN